MPSIDVLQVILSLFAAITAAIASYFAARMYRSKIQYDGNAKSIQDGQAKILDEMSEFSTAIMKQTLSVAPQFAFRPYQGLRPPTSSDITLLVTDVIPYLDALINFQHTLDEIAGREYREVRIKTIAQHSPISVSLDGAGEAIEVLNKMVIPWKRKHQEQMAHLAELDKQAEIEIKKAEVLERRAHATRDRQEANKLAAEALRQSKEAERLQLGNEKLRLEIHRTRIQLALEVLAKLEPNLSEADKTSYAVQLMPSLQVLTESLLQISIDQQSG